MTGRLAWTSQRFAAALTQWHAMAALRLIRVFDVLHEYACALEPARALPSQPLRPLASRTVEKSRLANHGMRLEDLDNLLYGEGINPASPIAFHVSSSEEAIVDGLLSSLDNCLKER